MAKVCYLLYPSGFCSGVVRAVSMLEQVLKLYGEVYIVEDIIHNKVFMDRFKDKGLKKVESLDDIPDGSVVMFSAHGVSPKTIQMAEQKSLTVIDGTCPIVKSIQVKAKEASESGKTIIIIGDMRHQEIIALWDCIDHKNAYVVLNEMDIDLLPDLSNQDIVCFTQTTLNTLTIQNILDVLKKRFPKELSDINCDICYATKERQTAVQKAASSVDLIIVVGSSYSSNTKKLVEVAQKAGVPQVIRIDTKDEIDLSIFENVQSFAIIASASAPDFITNDIIQYLTDNIEDLQIQKFDTSKSIDSEQK